MIIMVSSGHRPDDERIYHREIQSLLKTGFNLLYFTRWDGEMDLSDGNLTHINIPRKTTPIKNYIQMILNQLSDYTNLKVLHIHEFDLLPLAKNLKKKQSIRVFYDVHDTLMAMWETFSSRKGLVKKLVNKSLSFFELSHLMYVDEVILANKVMNENDYKQKGLHTTVVENYPRLDYVGKESRLSSNPTILYQGQISVDRGIHILVDAFKILNNVFPGARLKIIGKARPLSFKDLLIEKIKSTEIETLIELLDTVPHELVWEHMANADIGIIPSLSTPRVMVDTPTKLFEYMASGCPVVATDLPPVRHFLEGAGELVEPGSSEALAKGILTILQNEILFQEYSSTGMKRIVEQYHWEVAEKKLINLYQQNHQ